MAGEHATIGTKLSIQEAGTSPAAFKEIYGMDVVPVMGGKPNMLKVTNLNDTVDRFVRGVKTLDSLDFGFFGTDDQTDTTTAILDNWNTLREYDLDDTLLDFKLEFPNGAGFTWSGRISVTSDQITVNSPFKFTASVTVETALTDIT